MQWVRAVVRLDWGVARRAWSIAWPLMVADSFESILWLVDAYFVSFLGDDALAAVGLGGYLDWLFFTGATLFITGVLVVAGQSIGAGRRDVGRIIGEGAVSAFLYAIPIMAAGIAYAGPMIRVLAGDGVSPRVYEMAVEYFTVRLYSLPFLYAYMALDAGYRAAGVSKPVMVSVAVGGVANMILDPLLILGLGPFPRMGIRGAALASVIATIISLALIIAYSPSLGFRLQPALPGRRTLLMARVGLPALVERIVFVTGNLAYLGAVARCGDDALAAHTVGVRIESLAFLPLFSIGTVASSMVSQLVGSGDIREARRVGVEIAKFSFLAGVIVGGMLVALSWVVPEAFTDSEHVRRLATVYLILAGVTEPALALIFTLSQAIRGAGNTLVPTLVNVVGLYLLRVLPAFILRDIPIMGECVYSVWLAMVIDTVGRGLVFAVVYARYFGRLARKLV